MRLSLLLAGASLLLRAEDPANWPQFRGPNATGIAPSAQPPIEFGLDQRLLWKTATPPGHSSPAIWGDRILVTAAGENKLELICLIRSSGEIKWRRTIPSEKIEKVHQISSPATATPAVDGERVYVYFGSHGLTAFDLEGKQLWDVPLPLPATRFGSGTSPVVAGDMVLLSRDETKDGYLLAVDRRSGKTLWKQSYTAGGRAAESYSTPVVWQGKAILHRAGFIESYDLKDGARGWMVRAATSGTSTVAIGEDLIYVATWFPFGESDQVSSLPDFAGLLKYDADTDGKISESEFPADMTVFQRPDAPNVPGATMYLKPLFKQIDQNKDGSLQEPEWTTIKAGMASAIVDHGLIALKPGASDATVVWKEKTAIPEVPTPLVYRDRLYYVRNGGILSCLDAKSGKVIYRGRIGSGGPYYSSPIATKSAIYVASGDGVVTTLAPGDKLEVLARNDLQEEIFSTPAVVAGVLYVRTAKHLYAFGGD